MGKKWMMDAEKARILAWHQENVKMKEIIKRSGRSRTQIYMLIKNSKDLPPNNVPKHTSPTGRPRITKKKDDKFLRLPMLRNPFMTVSASKILHLDILVKLQLTHYGDISEQTYSYHADVLPRLILLLDTFSHVA